MSAIFIWISTQEAKLFHLKTNSIEVENLNYSGVKHHVESHGLNHPKTQTDEEVFYRQISEYLEKQQFQQILILGHGVVPKHFFKHLKKYHHRISEMVIGVEKVEKMPDSEVLSIGRKFLHRYLMYQGQLSRA